MHDWRIRISSEECPLSNSNGIGLIYFPTFMVCAAAGRLWVLYPFNVLLRGNVLPCIISYPILQSKTRFELMPQFVLSWKFSSLWGYSMWNFIKDVVAKYFCYNYRQRLWWQCGHDISAYLKFNVIGEFCSLSHSSNGRWSSASELNNNSSLL